MIRKIYLILLGIYAGYSLVYSQTPELFSKDAILDKVANQIKVFPQEKVYLHIDKSTYLPGDTLWFRAYLVDATFHLDSQDHRFVYAELVNPMDSIVSQVMIRQNENHVYQGYLPVSHNLAEGVYTLRAYTRYMIANERENIYKRPVHIVTSQWNKIKIKSVNGEKGRSSSLVLSLLEASGQKSVRDAQMSVKTKKSIPLKVSEKTNDIYVEYGKNLKEKNSSWLLSFKDNDGNYFQRFFPFGTTNEDYDVSFYPEGGYLLNGISCRVAFKAIGYSGNSIDVSLEVLDEEGQAVAVGQTLHEGMGVFTITPELDKKYKVICTNNYGREKTFDLPVVNERIKYGLKVDAQKESFKVTISSAVDAAPEPLYLIAHVRGMIIFSSELQESQKTFLFSKHDFPAGVVQFLLLDKKGNPLSERLAFSDNLLSASCDIDLGNSSMKKRELTNVKLQITDGTQQPIKGNFSISVTDSYFVPSDTCQTLVSYLLLTSEIKGIIRSPGFYFKGTAAARISLDLLMMIHGWRRYSIPDIVRANYASPVLERHSELAISGRTISDSPMLGKNTNEHIVSITGVGNASGFRRMIPTDTNGYFCFDSIEYSAGSGFYLEAMQLKGKKTECIELDVIKTSGLTELFPQAPLEDDSIRPVQSEEFMEISRIGNMHYLLRDVIVKAPFWGSRNYQKITDRDTNQYKDMRSIFGSMGMSIFSEAIEKETVETLVGDSVTNVNMKIDEGRVYETLYYGKQKVIVFVDDSYCEQSDMVINWLTPGDIENISFIKDVDRHRANALLMGSLHWGERLFAYGDLCSAYCKIPIKQETVAILNITTKNGFDSRCFGWWSHLYRDIQQNNQRMKTFYPLGYQLPIEFYSPKYDTEASKGSEVPDVRSTLYWQPELPTDEQGNASFSFYNSDQPADYVLIIEGISEKGELIHLVKRLK